MTAHRTPLAGVDAAWLRMDRPTNRMMITGVLSFDELLPLGELKTLLERRMLVFRRFKQRVTDPFGNPHWEDDPFFDLDRHVHRLALPEPGGQRELEILVSDLMNTPLDLSKPPWEMHLVEEYGSGCAVIVRLHHCIADGIALIYVLLSLADEYADASRLPAPGTEASEADAFASMLTPVVNAVRGTVRTTGAILQESASLLLNPAHLFKRAKQGMSVGAATSKLLLMRSDSTTRFKGDLGVTKHAAWSQPIPLQTAKTIAHQSGAKINDVLVAAVTGALRRYLLAHDEPVEGVNMRAVIPVNLRPPEEAYQLGNRFGLVFLSLPVGLVDERERLAEVKRRMDRIKHSSEALVALGLLQMIGNAPLTVQNQVVNLLSTRATAVMTNVPGPRERLHFMGRTLRHIMFWVPRAGDVSLGVSIKSYAGEVLLGVASDASLVPDPGTIVDAFHTEFAALKKKFRVTSVE